jgi:phosphoribosylformylglycinamidine synthase
VRIESSGSVLFDGMDGALLPIASSHGEGRAVFESSGAASSAATVLRYVTNRGEPAATYPANPNGSPGGAAGFTNADGRITIMMPHPERVFRSLQLSWHPREWGECSPWQRLFDNARRWIDRVG